MQAYLVARIRHETRKKFLIEDRKTDLLTVSLITLTLDLDLDFQFLTSYGHDQYMCRKSTTKVRRFRVTRRVETNERTDTIKYT